MLSLRLLWFSVVMLASVAEKNLSCVVSSFVETCVEVVIICWASCSALDCCCTATVLRWFERILVSSISEDLMRCLCWSLNSVRCGATVMSGFLMRNPLGVMFLVRRTRRNQYWCVAA